MVIRHQLTVPLPPDDVYAHLLDLDQVAPCVPGATLGAPDGTGTRAGTIGVQFGPMNFNYAGRIRIAEKDAKGRRAVLEADGRETRGEGGAKARVEMNVSAHDGGSLVSVETDLQLTGGLTQMGRGMIEEVSGELLDDFATCLERTMREKMAGGTITATSANPAEPVAPVNLFRLFVRFVLRRIRKLLDRDR